MHSEKLILKYTNPELYLAITFHQPNVIARS